MIVLSPPTMQATVDRCSSLGHGEHTPPHLSRSERTQEHWLAGSPMNSRAGGRRSSAMAVSLPTRETQVRCRSDTSMWMICGHTQNTLMLRQMKAGAKRSRPVASYRRG